MAKYNLDKEAQLFIERINNKFFCKDYVPNTEKNYHLEKEARDTQTFLDCMLLNYQSSATWKNPNIIENSYEYILETFSEEVVKARFKNILKEMNIFIDKSDCKNNAEINTVLLSYAVIDYFADIKRLKQFHNITNTNTAKIYAYTAFWLLREKPIQIVTNYNNDDLTTEDKDEVNKYLYLNEKFVTTYIISNILSDLDISVFSLEPDFVSEFYTLLLYNFKFRNYTAQSLELTIKGFQTGCTIGRQK